MKTYYIYDILTDEFLGTVQSTSIDAAELKALSELKITIPSDYVAAFTYKFK